MEPLVLKGPTLAGRYPEPGLRPMDDIDVFVPPDQHREASAVLGAAGWKEWAERDGGAHYDTVLFHHDVPHLPLELHRGLESWRDRSTHLRAMDLWRARRPIDCLGVAAFGLAPEDELLSLTIHAGKPFHQFERLIWAVDLAVVIETAPQGIDWDLVAARAHRLGSETVLMVGLVHARRLGAEVPDELLKLPRSRLRRAALAPVLDVRWPVTGSDPGMRHRLRYVLADLHRRQLVLAAAEITELGPAKVPAQAAQLVALGIRRWRTSRRAPEPEYEGLPHQP
jgi:hypothetical protein